MRTKVAVTGLFILLSMARVLVVGAQSPTVEWAAWNTQITAHANSQQLDVAETQIVNVADGTLHGGERTYSQPVNIQSVYLAVNGEQPKSLTQGSGPGSYQVTSSGGQIVLDYTLPTAVNAGDQFVVQINYNVNSPTSGLVDWFAVPGDHDAPVSSATVTINFPDGQVPSTDFVRMGQTTGSVTTEGNSIVIRSQSVIPAGQAFEVQVPYGVNVGEPGNSGNTSSNPVQTVPTNGTDTSTDTSGLGFGTILILLCVVGLLIVAGGRGLLGGLLGGLGGGLLGGRPTGYGNDPYNQPNGGYTNQPTSRGFRESSNQNRSIPTISSDKRQGGGAKFR